MSKQKKIKRYGNIYSGKGSGRTPFLIIGMVAAALVLAVAGWSIYTPVQNFFEKLAEQNPPASEPQPAESLPSGSQSAVAPSEPQKQAPALRGVYAPPAVAGNLSKLDDFLANAKDGRCNAVLVDAKDASGKVLYQSKVPLALESGAVAAQAFDGTTVAKKIAGQGMTPIARIQAFRDPLLPKTAREAAVSYLDSDWTWLDNSQELGGRPWLSPYSAVAKQYIIDLAVELTGQGYELILVDSVQFPSGVGLEKAGYGPDAAAVSRQQALQSFVRELDEKVEAAGGRAAVYYSGQSVLSDNELVYGGNPLSIPQSGVVVGMMPESLPANAVIGEETIADPRASFSATVHSMAGYTVKTVPPGVTVVAMLQANAADGAALPVQKIDEQVRALEGTGVTGYILYNPQGTYRFK